MNKRMLLILFIVTIVIVPFNKITAMDNSQAKVIVISDIHLLAPSLFDDGKAAHNLDDNDMKMVLHSDLIMQRMVNKIIKEKPQLLIISGDLTFNGARASHEQLVKHLRKLEQEGITALVIPGNHDVKCPYSKSYLGNEAQQIATITSKEFVQLYSDFGYGGGAERDSASLSYACEPIPGLVVLCIDSNRYEENKLATKESSSVVYHSDGIVKTETVKWIKCQLDKARLDGKRVIAVMHHHLLEHVDREAQLLPNYIVANHDEVANVLRQGGVKAVFTGHLHITDAVEAEGIIDVATGSASTYPLPMREVKVDLGLGSMNVTTSFFDDIDDEVLNQGRNKVENSVDGIANLISQRLWSKLSGRLQSIMMLMTEHGIDVSKFPQSSDQLSELLLLHLRRPLAQSFIAVSRGGEDPKQASAIINAVKKGVKDMIADIFPDEDGLVGDVIIENAMPRVEPVLRSALEDINQVGTPQQSTTNDHTINIAF